MKKIPLMLFGWMFLILGWVGDSFKHHEVKDIPFLFALAFFGLWIAVNPPKEKE